MNKEVEIRIPERQINKNEVPKYSKFVFMWWFDYLNGFQLISSNRNSLKKKISSALSVIGFLISILICVSSLGLSAARNFRNIVEIHFDKDTYFPAFFWLELHYMHIIYNGLIGIIFFVVNCENINSILDEINQIQLPENSRIRIFRKNNLIKNLQLTWWQSYGYYLTWIVILITITVEESFWIFTNFGMGKVGYYSHYHEFTKEILFSKNFLYWHTAHHLIYHTYLCWIITKKFLFINNFLIEIKKQYLKPEQKFLELVQQWYESLLRISQSIDKIFYVMIPHIYLVFSFSTVAHGLLALQNFQRDGPQRHLDLFFYHLFLIFIKFPNLLYSIKQTVNVEKEARRVKNNLIDYIIAYNSKLGSSLFQQYDNTKEIVSRKVHFTYFNLIKIDRQAIVKTILFIATTFCFLIRFTQDHLSDKVENKNVTIS
jgi:hypothetical protein